MALACALSNGRPAALLVKRNANAAILPAMYLSTDMHHAYPGHTAVVNLVQHVYKEGWSFLQNAEIYLTDEPSDADYGIFIEQIKQARGGEPRLYFTMGNGHLCECRPTKITDDPRNLKQSYAKIRLSNGMRLSSLNGLWAHLTAPGAGTIGVQGNTATVAAGDGPLVQTLLTNRINTAAAVKRRFGIVPYSNDGTAPPFDQADYPDTANGRTFAHLPQAEQDIFDSLFLLVCYALAAPSPPVKGKHGDTAKVGALMVSPRGGILSWGADFSATFHAEVSTLKLYQDGGLNLPPPVGTRFYTSLEPCFMCSGLINTAYSLIPGFAVRYGQIDPAVRQQASTFLKNSNIDERKATTRYDIGGAKGLFADRLNQKGTQDLGDFAPNIYRKSVMKQLDVPSFRRMYAKAALDLLAMPYVIMRVPDTYGDRTFLLHAWKNAMTVLSRAKGSSIDPLMRRMGHYLDQTRGLNPIKAATVENYGPHNKTGGPDKYRDMADTFLRAFWHG